jgi:hypothetical protein
MRRRLDEDAKRRLGLALVGADSAGPAGVDAVSALEEDLGVRLPASYRLFLENWGAAVGSGWSIAGIPGATVAAFFEDARAATLAARTCSKGLPRTFVYVADDGSDCSYFLATEGVSEDGECPVVVLGPGLDGEVCARDFVDFVTGYVQGNLYP